MPNPKWKLKGRIISMYGSQREFAKAIGKTEQTVTSKLAGRTEFTQGDIIEWGNALDLDGESLIDYFFTDYVSKN